MTDHQTVHLATGGFIANPERPYIVGEQPQCCLGMFYPTPVSRTAVGRRWSGKAVNIVIPSR
ncbi:hypothetical protein WBP07_17965 [Novosphingobium sp. BL-8A]|uniref:hypothetical protein n=1 Tax=Novosphingobium sp. BL-8A TaxID=3127639 RepID=UPI003756B1BC